MEGGTFSSAVISCDPRGAACPVARLGSSRRKAHAPRSRSYEPSLTS
jgi:hypothetical protein